MSVSAHSYSTAQSLHMWVRNRLVKCVWSYFCTSSPFTLKHKHEGRLALQLCAAESIRVSLVFLWDEMILQIIHHQLRCLENGKSWLMSVSSSVGFVFYLFEEVQIWFFSLIDLLKCESCLGQIHMKVLHNADYVSKSNLPEWSGFTNTHSSLQLVSTVRTILIPHFSLESRM